MGTTNDKLSYLTETKEALKTAIINKGVSVSEEDTFRSYPEKINSIQGGETITKAFLPADFKGSTALGSTILINPASYYQSVTSDYEAETGYTYNNGVAIPLQNLICFVKKGVPYFIWRDESGNYQTNLSQDYYKVDNTYRLTTQLSSDFVILFNSQSVEEIKLVRYDSNTNSLVLSSVKGSYQNMSMPNSISSIDERLRETPLYYNQATKTIYLASANTQYTLGIISWDLMSSVGPQKMNSGTEGNCPSNSKSYEGLYISNSASPVAYMLVKGETFKITNLAGSSAKANFSKIYTSTNTLTTYTRATQMLDGSYSFIIADNALWIYKQHQNENGDFYWEYDEEKTTFFRTTVGDYLGKSFYLFLPQIDNSVYVQADDLVFGFQYHPEVDIFEQIEHPCAAIIETLSHDDKGNGSLFTYVNKVTGIASISKKNNTTGIRSVLTFSINEKPNLENIHWVAYEPKRTNYITNSITAVSNGVTGMDANGNSYIEVKKLKESYDLGDHLPGPQDPSHETETSNETTTDQTIPEETPSNTEAQESNDTETETPTESSGETQPISESTPEETPVSEDITTLGGNEIDTTNT